MTKDGGQAFPLGGSDIRGMTLRDYFAAAALQGMLASDAGMGDVEETGVFPFHHDHAIKGTAARAYKIADAMLAERAK